MYLIATNEYLVNIISYMFFDFFSPFCTFANGQKYQKYEESFVSKFIDVGNIAKYSICCESTICATVNYGGDSMIILVMRDMFLVCLFLLYI